MMAIPGPRGQNTRPRHSEWALGQSVSDHTIVTACRALLNAAVTIQTSSHSLASVLHRPKLHPNRFQSDLEPKDPATADSVRQDRVDLTFREAAIKGLRPPAGEHRRRQGGAATRSGSARSAGGVVAESRSRPCCTTRLPLRAGMASAECNVSSVKTQAADPCRLRRD